MSVDDFNEGIGKIMFRWTESQLVKDMDRLVAELGASSGKSVMSSKDAETGKGRA